MNEKEAEFDPLFIKKIGNRSIRFSFPKLIIIMYIAFNGDKSGLVTFVGNV